MPSFRFTVEPIAPFRLDLTVWALRRRPDNAIDRWDGATYRRVIALPAGPVEVAVTDVGRAKAPRLEVEVTGRPLSAALKADVTAALQRLLGLQVDLAGFYRLARGDARLAPLARRFVGVKPPRLGSVFEAVLNGIACQQVTLTLGIQLLSGLSAHHGVALGQGPAAAHAMPRPEDLAELRPEDLRPLGFSRQKGRAIIELSQAIVQRRLDLEEMAELSDAAAVDRLRSLRGIGRWTAEYVLLRGLGRTHVFPGDDVGARNNLQRWMSLPEPPDYDEIQRRLAPWAPYGGLIYFHMLLDRLDAAGHLQLSSSEGEPTAGRDDGRLNKQRRLPMVQIKRVYDKPTRADGLRVLVDRLWPRGLTKEKAAVAEWQKDLAPSTELRKWFAHDPEKWKEFQTRYRKELAEKRDAVKELKRKCQEQTVTLLYGARDEVHNEATVLQKILQRRS